jgi:hypothetical protein
MTNICEIGDFSFMNNSDHLSRIAFEDAWETINKMPGAIDFIRNKNPYIPWAFTSDHNCIKIINNLSLIDQHSGCSIAVTMRTMENIIKYGWDVFVVKYIKIQLAANS